MHNKSARKQQLVALALTAALIALGASQADAQILVPVPIQNYSFETPDPSDSNIPADWTVSDPSEYYGYSGYLRANDDYVTAPDGNNILEVAADDTSNPVSFTWSQTTGDTASIGDTFTLNVDTAYANNADAALPGGVFALTIGGVPVAYSTGGGTAIPTSTPTYFFDQTLTFTAATTGVVGVELITPYGSQIDFDNVRLDVAVAEAPEPSTWAMMFAGVFALIGWQRSRRQV